MIGWAGLKLGTTDDRWRWPSGQPVLLVAAVSQELADFVQS
jgi:hypothetical protein